MLKLPEKGTLIAPSSLHFPLYTQMTKAYGNYLGLDIKTMDAYCSNFYNGTNIPLVELAFRIRKAWESISKDNVFYTSLSSFDFIQASIAFLRFVNSYGLDYASLPENNTKEKDLKELVMALADIPFQEEQISDFIKEKRHFDDLYILGGITNPTQSLWLQYFLSNGAHLISNETLPKRIYTSVANISKQARYVCQTILEEDLDASDIFICVQDEASRQALAFMMDSYQIPYTFLSTNQPAPIQDACIRILEWIIHQDVSSFNAMIKCLYPDTQTYTQSFIERFKEILISKEAILPKSYSENQLIDSYSFERMTQMEHECLTWLEEHEELFHLKTLEDVLNLLQNVFEPSTDTILDFNALMETLSQSCSWIENNDDLDFLVQILSSSQRQSSAKTLQGALIGNREEITSLRSICFFLDAHAKNFPNLKIYTGVFDEAYLAKLNLPSLADRLDLQRQQLFALLKQPSVLYCVVPEASFDGKSNPTSHELDQWMQTKLVFYDFEENDVYDNQSFHLDAKTAKSLFLKNSSFKGSISCLESYARCPFQYFLRYGLRLQEKRDVLDIRSKGSIYHHILEVLIQEHEKDYTKVTKEQLEELVTKEFAFARSIFKDQASYFDVSRIEIQKKMELVLDQLQAFESEWHMPNYAQEHHFHMAFEWKDHPILLHGFIDRIDASNSSFVIFDYKSSDKKISLNDFECGLALQLITYTIAYEQESGKLPYGCFYISLKTSSQTGIAYKVRYNKKLPEAVEQDIQEQSQEILEKYKLEGLSFQDMETYCDTSRFTKKKEVPEFHMLQEQWNTIIQSLLEDICSGNIAAEHDADACKYCAYKSICRNQATAVKKKNRLEEKEED